MVQIRYYLIISISFVCSGVNAVLNEDVFDDSLKTDNTDIVGAFYSKDEIMNKLSQEKYKNDPDAQSLLHTFLYQCKKTKQPKYKELKPRPFPFIVIEATCRKKRRELAHVLAESLGARLMLTIPKCLANLEIDIRNKTELKRIFFALSVYINSMNVNFILRKAPVVLTGYWMDLAAFSLARTYTKELPEPSSELYEFPADLTKPDMCFFICRKDSFTPMSKETVEFNERSTTAYRRMRNPGVYELNITQVTATVVFKIRNILKDRLSSKFPNLRRC